MSCVKIILIEGLDDISIYYSILYFLNDVFNVQ